MSIATYSELQTAIANWVKRNDLTTVIPDFISLAEKKINRTVRAAQMDSVANLSTSIGSRLVAYPTRSLEVTDLTLSMSTGEKTLRWVAPRAFENYITTSNQEPYAYTLRDQIELDSPADAVYTLKARYIKGWDIAADTTNWLLTNYPDIYLFASLTEVANYIYDDQRSGMWAQRYSAAIEELNSQEARHRNPGMLTTETPRGSYTAYDIRTM